MDSVEAQQRSAEAARGGWAAAFKRSPPRSPALPPAALCEELLVGSHWFFGLGMAALVPAYFIGHLYITYVILAFSAMFGGLALSRLRLAFSLWRSGVLTSGKITEDVAVKTNYIRDGEHVGTGYSHRIRLRFVDSAGRPGDAAFETVQKTRDEGIHKDGLELVYVPGRWLRPWRGVVLLPESPGDQLRVCAILGPGASTSVHTFVQVARLIAWLGVLYAAYWFVPGVRYAVAMFHLWFTGTYIPFPF